ncbi:hypothetical protein DUI87_13327 [Hirundo rustica rustica]|uniref:DNA/RNA non-specific endonuclease domain-containing protein n=1 Tax=Hirundo rustica rustica TaxID=333673 RepID=A0A3M0KBK2_HIRRU|nr:hypothetical protein DUI87_13327 [Hirundo rustica rustica]
MDGCDAVIIIIIIIIIIILLLPGQHGERSPLQEQGVAGQGFSALTSPPDTQNFKHRNFQISSDISNTGLALPSSVCPGWSDPMEQRPVTELMNLTFSTKAAKSSNEDNQIEIYAFQCTLLYIYGPGPGNRSKSWYVEPQQIGQSQAINQDYNNLQGLDHGHLSPSCHRSGNNSKWSTFTLTNIVPQNSILNQGTWNDYETKTMALQTQGCNITYVIVGAVPGTTSISNNRVNVPSHIWSAACCQTNTSMKTWAVIAENNRNQVQNLTLAGWRPA